MPGWTSNGNGGGFAYTRTFLVEESGCGVPFVPAVTGGSDAMECNYDPEMEEGDNSLCTYPGCQDATACNYDADAGCPAPCTFPDVCGDCGGSGTVAGCTFSGACNYDPAADCDDGSCLFLDACGVCGGSGTEAGCTVPAAVNYSATANCDNGLCVIVGCTNADAFNFNPAATADDGSCLTWSCDYTGAEVVDFEKVDLADWTLPENQDRVQANLWITRQNNQGLYTHFDQPSWPGGAVGGPTNTEWKAGLTDEPGTYDSWLNAAGGSPSANIFEGAEYSLHVLDTDLYFDVTWVYFSNGSNAGGFAYQRVLNTTLSGCEEVPFVAGCTDDTALNYEPESTFDDGSCVFGDDTASCPGDLTGDGVVGTQDLLAILGLFGTECE